MRLDWKALLGLGVTAFLLWFILRDVDFREVWANVRQANWGILFAAIVVATSGFLVRAWRWKVLLAPVRPDTSLKSRFAAVNIGFMANNLLPARVGEFARAYALSRVEPVPMSAALGTLVVERVLDALVLMGILLASMSSPAFPSAAEMSSGPLGAALDAIVVLLMVLVFVLAVLIAMPRQVVRFAERVAAALPGDLGRPVVDALESFLSSLKVLSTPRLLVVAVLWSVGFWLFHGLSFWLGMLAFDIHAGPVAAYFTEAVVGFGVAIPAAPGFFGTFHASASWALSVFGVPDASSLAFAFGYHLGGFIPVTLIGLYYAGTIGLSLKDVGSSGERVEEAVERELPVAARVLAGRSGAAAERVADDVVAVLVNAPAKVNLSLRVGARRPDGFHDLQTLFQGIDLCDSVEVRREGSGIAVSVSGGELGPIEENLVTRAVRAYLGAAGPRAEPAPGIRVRLEKRIPVAAGLGGGSSDAAATLRALDRLFEGAVGHADLLGIAANLGSDVPFFLSLTPLAVGRGRGELLDALDPLPALPGLLVVPELPVPTGEAYAALDRARGSASPPPPAPPPNPRDWADVARGAHNDFEAVVAPVHPEVRDALAALRATAPLIALLSGSGSACFALYRTDHEAQVAQVAAASLARGRWRVAPFRTLAAWPKPTEL